MKSDRAKKLVSAMIEETEAESIEDIVNAWTQTPEYRAYFRASTLGWSIEDELGEPLFEKPWKRNRAEDFEYLWAWSTSKYMKW